MANLNDILNYNQDQLSNYIKSADKHEFVNEVRQFLREKSFAKELSQDKKDKLIFAVNLATTLHLLNKPPLDFGSKPPEDQLLDEKLVRQLTSLQQHEEPYSPTLSYWNIKPRESCPI